jgi:hypothetical protein
MIQRRLKREKRAALSSPGMRPGKPGSKPRAVAGGAVPASDGAPAAPVKE